MFVETVFWFHTLVWIGKRMVDERERACDEEVTRSLGAPRAHAEALLDVGKRYMESPLASAPGIGGSNLRRRIERILQSKSPLRLTLSRKIVLAVTGFSAIAGPVAVGLLNAPFGRAQTPQRAASEVANLPGAERPKYEVSSIKPNAGNDLRVDFRIEPNGTLTATGLTLKRLMMTAYQVQGFRIVGGPDWIASLRWDVQAKSSFSRALSNDQIWQMLRTMLEERFHLHTHSEKRNLPVYELLVDRDGSKVPTAKDAKANPIVRVAPGSIELTDNTSATFASQLSYALARPVIDKTGLSGKFDFAIRWTPFPGEDGGPTTSGLPPGTPEPPASIPAGPSLFTAIRDQLGLRLKSARDPVEVVVIDNVQMPTAN